MTEDDTQVQEELEVPAEASVEQAPVKQAEPTPTGPQLPGGYCYGTGRRKTAVARVRIKSGSGEFLVNKRKKDEFFKQQRDRKMVVAPLEATQTLGRYDIFVNVSGGGFTGQAGAVVLGLARALRSLDAAHEQTLRDGGYLTRDSRMVERKKYGRRGARRSFQFSKR